MKKMVPTSEAELVTRTRGRNLRGDAYKFYEKTGKTFEQAFFDDWMKRDPDLVRRVLAAKAEKKQSNQKIAKLSSRKRHKMTRRYHEHR